MQGCVERERNGEWIVERGEWRHLHLRASSSKLIAFSFSGLLMGALLPLAAQAGQLDGSSSPDESATVVERDPDADGQVFEEVPDQAGAPTGYQADEPEGAIDHLIRAIRLPHPRSDIWPGFETMGITLNLSLTSIYQQNARGGLSTRNAHRVTGSFDMELTLDTERMGLWPGGELYAYAESGWSDGIDRYVGSLFPVNGDAIGDEPIRLIELWYQQMFLEDKIRLKFGKMDLAVDIDTNAYANWEVTQFLNDALINTGNMPLPDYGLGVVLSVLPTDWLYVTLAAADAQARGGQTGFNTAFHGSADFFSALEVGFTPVWETSRGRHPGAYRFILWYDPQSKPVFFDDEDGQRRTPYRRDDTGFAFNMDQLVFKENPSEDDTQGVGVFFRYGYANDQVNEVEHFWSVGAQYQGLLPGWDDDVLAFGFAQGLMSDQLRAVEGWGSRESVYEVYYNAAITRWLHITPDIQYISNPGGDRSNRDAVVLGVRVVVAF